MRLGKDKKPARTDDGNILVDAVFGPIRDPKALDDKLHGIPGIVETGLFIGMAKEAFLGLDDGSVKVLKPIA